VSNEALTDAMIEALRTEAGAAGDRLMVKACDMALEGDAVCRDSCAGIITAARAMDDSTPLVVVDA